MTRATVARRARTVGAGASPIAGQSWRTRLAWVRHPGRMFQLRAKLQRTGVHKLFQPQTTEAERQLRNKR